jgi:hypothetical protein
MRCSSVMPRTCGVPSWLGLWAIVQACATVFSGDEADLARLIAHNFEISKTVKNVGEYVQPCFRSDARSGAGIRSAAAPKPTGRPGACARRGDGRVRESCGMRIGDRRCRHRQTRHLHSSGERDRRPAGLGSCARTRSQRGARLLRAARHAEQCHDGNGERRADDDRACIGSEFRMSSDVLEGRGN